MAQTMEQKRAAYAFKVVTQATHLSGKTPQKYKNLAKGLPQMIMNSGLMPTLAFLCAKDETHHLQLYNHISTWLASRGQNDKIIDLTTMMNHLTNAPSLEFQALTTEALAILKWIRQLASAVIQGDE